MRECTVQKDVPLAGFTTLGVGGNAEYFVEVDSLEAVHGAIQWANKHDLQIEVLGGGSNVLIADAGIRGLVVKYAAREIVFKKEAADVVLVVSDAGAEWDDLVRCTVEEGFWGLENLSGIPGSVGGAVVQNINAYGVTIEDVIECVQVLHIPTGTVHTLAQKECLFAYRDSLFKQKKGNKIRKEYVITQVELKVYKKNAPHTLYRSSSQSMETYLLEHAITDPTPADIREAVLAIRSRIGMLRGMYQSAGSFFKNVVVDRKNFDRIELLIKSSYSDLSKQFHPWHWTMDDGSEKISAAFLMECTEFNKTAFAGKTFNGTVGISPVHTLSIINVKNASAADIRNFVEEIQKSVENEFGIALESEVCFLQ